VCVGALLVAALVAPWGLPGCARDEAPEVRLHVEAARVAGPVHDGLLGYNHLWAFGGQGIVREGTTPPQLDAGMTEAIRDLGVRLLRYPGGTISHTYRWLDGVGPVADRRPVPIPRFEGGGVGGIADVPTYGTDEFLALCSAVRAEPLIVVAFDSGTPEEAAAWVAYLNAHPGDATAIGVDAHGFDWKTAGHWASLRARNGHAEPYGVRRFEIGNETDLDRFPCTVEEYALAFARYAERMKAVDPAIQLGAVGHAEPGEPGNEDRRRGTDLPWNETLLDRVGARIDFLCLHTYALDDGWADASLDVLADPVVHGRKIREIRDRVRAAAPGRAIEIAVTEYGTNLKGPHSPEQTGNASLRAALCVADTFFEFVRSDVSAACLHVLAVELRGAPIPFQHFASVLREGDRLIRTPNYGMFRLLARHLGRRRVAVDVVSPEFSPTFDPGMRIPFVSALATAGPRDGALTLFVLNKHRHRTLRVDVAVEGLAGAAAHEGWLFSGPTPEAGSGPDAAELAASAVPLDVATPRFRLALPPLSLLVVPLEVAR